MKPEAAAKYKRMIWQGHDELNKKKCEKGASQLYGILASAEEERRRKAGEEVQRAFWLADKAEEHQKKNIKKEEKFYREAEKHLRKAQKLVGLETDSVKYRINWWKAYRHREPNRVLENMIKEHEVLFDKEKAEKCANLLLKAAELHGKKEWEAVGEKLKAYFEIYLKN